MKRHPRDPVAARPTALLLILAAFAAFAAFMSPTSAIAAKYPKYLPPCKPIVTINLRGSGQSGPTLLEKPSHTISKHDPVKTVLGSLQSLVGDDVWANISHTDAPYAAIPVKKNVDFVHHEYNGSRKDGETTLDLLLSALHSKCPGAQTVLIGYSQGADGIGDQLPKVRSQIRAKIAGVVLFGDPQFNPKSRAARGDFNPGRRGIRGARSEFPSGVPVISFCRNLDVVCQGIAGFRFVWSGPGGTTPTQLPEGFEGAAHSRYQEGYAAEAAQWLRARLSDRNLLNLAPPTASLTPLDVSFTIDSTGSMDDAISSVRNHVSEIRSQLATQTSSIQAALTEFRDEPSEDSDFQARLLTDLTPDSTIFDAALGKVTADGGDDRKESVFAGLNQALGVSWRETSSKAVVLIGDAPPKDPEPITGATANDVVRRANLGGVPIHTLVVANDEDTTAAFADLSKRTAGITANVEDPGSVAHAIISTMQRHAGSPTAATTRTVSVATSRADPAPGAAAGGFVGVPVLLSAATSSSPLGAALSYTWDFGDGQTVTTAAPVVAHTWASPYVGDVTLTVTDSAGRSARTVQPVGIADGAPPAVGRPTKLRTSVKPGTLRVRWRHPSIGDPVVFRILSGNDVLGEHRPKRVRKTYDIALKSVVRCQRLRIRVEAADALGRTATSKQTKGLVVKPPKRQAVRRNGKAVRRNGKIVRRVAAGSCKR